MHANRLTRRHPFAAACVFCRLIVSNTTNDIQAQHVASTFHWATVESLSQAHRVTINDLSRAHTAMVRDLNSAHTRAMKELVDQIVTLQNERRETKVALTENIGKITVSRVKDAGVQPVINAVARGKFDDSTSTFQNAKATVIRKLTTHGRIKKHDVAHALASHYSEISKHHHTGVSDVLTLCHGEQTVAETIASLSLILFARRLYSSKFDALYTDANGNVPVTLSKL
ncbi:hypothetical protein B0H14DRAFT_2799657 [Mycena olivaceomarginata]|nr:hypothetical protein B0H14DRAFT_2799657 [Mycena olivaceomarginata]